MKHETKEIFSSKANDFIIRLKTINHSIKNHLSPEYKKQYIIKRVLSSSFLYFTGVTDQSIFN